MTTNAKPKAQPKSGALPMSKRRLLNAAVDIQQNPPSDIDYLHSTMCQVGFPRKRVEGTMFRRSSGTTTILLESGSVQISGKLVEQGLPYGTHPRLVMVHLSSEAVRLNKPVVEVGKTTREFLRRLGIGEGGGPRGGLTSFRKQMQALVGCRLTLGYTQDGHDRTIYAKPIEEFDAWLQNEETQTSLWPGIITLSDKFFETLKEHAVPLDPRALGALKSSSLALDIYCWLANRLCRIPNNRGQLLSWQNLGEQFGQEYRDFRNFKAEFSKMLRQVRLVYPTAKLEPVTGGLMIYSSPPPIPKTQIVAAMPSNGDFIPWQDRPTLQSPAS